MRRKVAKRRRVVRGFVHRLDPVESRPGRARLRCAKREKACGEV